jgi:gamma-glutamyltranspeptidase/glutathione hydrolase
MTTSIESIFGSRLMTRGFMLNNQMTDFSFRPSSRGRPIANRIAPDKRPRSSMAPTLVFDREGRLVLAVGSPGGSRIIAYVVKALIAVLDWEMDLAQAFALPNHTNRNGPIDLEDGTALVEIKPALEALGHEVRIQRNASGYHGIRVTPEGFDGAADTRREGVADGD